MAFTPLTIQPGVYTLVGSGNMSVIIENGPNVWLVDAATQPTPGTVGTLVSGSLNGPVGQDFVAANLVWAMPVPSNFPSPSTIGFNLAAGNSTGAAAVSLSAAQITALDQINIIGTGGIALDATMQSVLTSLNALNAKNPPLGQALAAGSIPVVLTVTQLASLTAPVVAGALVPGGGSANTSSSYDDALATIVDSTSNTSYVYFCEALPGVATSAASWRISRLELSTGKTTWATGGVVGGFKDIADNRNTTITYA